MWWICWLQRVRAFSSCELELELFLNVEYSSTRHIPDLKSNSYIQLDVRVTRAEIPPGHFDSVHCDRWLTLRSGVKMETE